MESIHRWLERVSQRALCNLPTLYATYSVARHCVEYLKGDFVECGVFAGVQVAAMARALIEHGAKDRKIYLFDSFEGIPKPGRYDVAIRELLGAGNGELETTGVSACSMESVQQHMKDWDIDPSLLVYVPGWFQNTLPDVAPQIEKISLLRLDGDLYESTKVCLEHLYPKLVKGGFCIADDYALDGCRRAIAEYLQGGPACPVYWQKF